MQASFIQQGNAGIIKARAVESRLMTGTWSLLGYDLLPNLKTVNIPTLIITGDHEFIPAATAEHITQAIPNAHTVILKDCGHFTYLECPVASVNRLTFSLLARRSLLRELFGSSLQ
jgi:proline iminopeptidase